MGKEFSSAWRSGRFEYLFLFSELMACKRLVMSCGICCMMMGSSGD
jgi:hypothetical protein